MKRLIEFLEDNLGNLSSARLFAFLITLATVTDWMHAVWMLPSGVWQPSYQTVGMVLGVLGFKVLQKRTENKN